MQSPIQISTFLLIMEIQVSNQDLKKEKKNYSDKNDPLSVSVWCARLDRYYQHFPIPNKHLGQKQTNIQEIVRRVQPSPILLQEGKILYFFKNLGD